MKITTVQFIILALAVYRICRLIIQDQVLETARNLIWSKFPYDKGIGYLITCYWCTGFWVSSLVVTCFIIVPIATTAVCSVLALSAAAAIIAARVDD